MDSSPGVAAHDSARLATSVIDLHAHYLSPDMFDLDRSGVSVSYDPDSSTFEFPSGRSRPVPEPLIDLEARSAWTAAQSIDLQVLSPWMDLIGDDLPAYEAEAWCRSLNDTTAADIRSKQNFRAFAALPLGDGIAAARELDRAVADLGFVGGAISSQVAGVDLDDAGLDPLFEAAVSLAAPLFVHPFRVVEPERLRRYFLNNICGVPFDTTVAAFRLFFSGTMDRWPDLKIVLAHCGGALPYLAGRAAKASRSVSVIEHTVESSDEILSRFFYDTMLHDPHALGFAVSRVGVDRMVVGTDAPFPMQIEPVVGHIRDALAKAGLGEGAFETITERTAQSLLRLDE